MKARLKAPGKILILLGAILFSPDVVCAIPREVILYPEAAIVTEAKRIRLNIGRDRHSAVFNLPASALPQSLKVSLPADTRLRIQDVTHQAMPDAPEERLRDLQRQLTMAEEDRIRIRAALTALEGQILFWQTQAKGRAKNAAEAQNLAQLIGRSLKKAQQEKMQREREGEQNATRIKELKAELTREQAKSGPAWQVTVYLTGPATPEIPLSWTYLMRACGWRPAYRLQAFTDEKRIIFTREASAWQDSGQDWRQVNLILASGEPGRDPSPTPVALRAVKTQPDARPGKTSSPEEKKAPPSAVTPEPEPALLKGPAEAPVFLGIKTLADKARVKIPIAEETWPAEFVYRLRPGQATPAILTGFALLPTSRLYPTGDALFFVEGAFWRSGSFGLQGNNVAVEFGADPQIIVASRRTLEKSELVKEGAESFRLQRWHVSTVIHNLRDKTVRLQLEEGLPQFADSRIRATFHLTALPEESAGQEPTWRRDLAPRETLTFPGQLLLTMPPSLEVLP